MMLTVSMNLMYARVYLSGCAAKNETLDEFRDKTHEY